MLDKVYHSLWEAKRHLIANVIFLLLWLMPIGTCSYSEHGHVTKYS